MTDRLPWFRCFPSALLGALAGMGPDVGITYVTILMRIYETGGPVAEDARSLSFRTGMTERRATAALERLLAIQKISRLDDGRLDSPTTHAEIEWQQTRHEVQSAAGKASAAKRAEKHSNGRGMKRDRKSEQLQRKAAAIVEREFNHLDLDLDNTPNPPSGDPPPEPEITRRGCLLPSNWHPIESHYAKAQEAGFSAPFVDKQAELMREWAQANSNRGVARKADWGAAFHTWLRRAIEDAKTKRGASHESRSTVAAGRRLREESQALDALERLERSGAALLPFVGAAGG